jgi:NADH-quinone oxidoreductase subunit K
MSLPIWTVALIAIMGLLGVGFYGLLISRNLIKIVVALQVLVKGAIIAMVVAGKLHGEVMLGQTMALTVIVADTIVAVIGLALAVQVRRYCGSLDLQALSSLRR